MSSRRAKPGKPQRLVRLSPTLRKITILLAHTAYLLAFSSLLIFSVLSVFYLYRPTSAQSQEHGDYEIRNATAREVACSFPASGQYGITLQWSYYALLIVTVTLRQRRWLAAGTAAYALTYSGVAAIHLIVLAVVYGRSSSEFTRSTCEWWRGNTMGIEDIPDFPICTGVYDPDFAEACVVVGAGLLAALPMAMWSTTFQHASAKPILFMWTSLLAVGHLVFNLIVPDNHRHYQICPSGVEEPLPGREYDAVPIDLNWQREFLAIIAGNTSSQTCLYTCFQTNAYLGRRSDEIGVYTTDMLESARSNNERGLGIAYWFLYVLLALAVLLAERHERWLRFRLVAYGRRLVQVISVAAYLGFVGWLARQPSHGGVPQSEGFDSVGQWSVVATVCMVLMAAVAGKITARCGGHEECRTSDVEKGDDADDGDDGDEVWSCEIGYAS
jgi:hypothetical protein